MSAVVVMNTIPARHDTSERGPSGVTGRSRRRLPTRTTGGEWQYIEWRRPGARHAAL